MTCIYIDIIGNLSKSLHVCRIPVNKDEVCISNYKDESIFTVTSM